MLWVGKSWPCWRQQPWSDWEAGVRQLQCEEELSPSKVAPWEIVGSQMPTLTKKGNTRGRESLITWNHMSQTQYISASITLDFLGFQQHYPMSLSTSFVSQAHSTMIAALLPTLQNKPWITNVMTNPGTLKSLQEMNISNVTVNTYCSTQLHSTNGQSQGIYWKIAFFSSGDSPQPTWGLSCISLSLWLALSTKCNPSYSFRRNKIYHFCHELLTPRCHD